MSLDDVVLYIGKAKNPRLSAGYFRLRTLTVVLGRIRGGMALEP